MKQHPSPSSALNRRQVPNLKHLFLNDNGLGADATAAMLPALLTLHRLEVLDLCGNELDLVVLRHAIQGMPQLKSLNLGASGLSASVPALVSALLDLRLEALHLNDAGITGGVLRELGRALCSLGQLRSLNLADNPLGASGTRALGAVLHGLPQLTSLLLGGTQLGARTLAKALPEPSTMSLGPRAMTIEHASSVKHQASSIRSSTKLQAKKQASEIESSKSKASSHINTYSWIHYLRFWTCL